LTRFGVDYLLKQVACAAGVTQSVSSNVLRRRFVMTAHANGSDLDEIRHQTGHAHTRTTRRYLEAEAAQ
jgi:site-specific recombinase XerD